jgi:hypothetical protein
MDLKQYLKSLADEAAREAFAISCGTTLGHLTNVAYGKTCGPALAVALEQKTDGVLRRIALRPDDWHLIWPELIGSQGAPRVKLKKAA